MQASNTLINSNGSKLEQTKPPILSINLARVKKLSRQEQLHCVAHEMQHFSDNHMTETFLVKDTLRAHGHKNFENNSAYKAYIAIQEKCDDLLPCMYDKKIAQAGLYRFSREYTFRRVSVHPYASQETRKIAIQDMLSCY